MPGGRAPLRRRPSLSQPQLSRRLSTRLAVVVFLALLSGRAAAHIKYAPAGAKTHHAPKTNAPVAAAAKKSAAPIVAAAAPAATVPRYAPQLPLSVILAAVANATANATTAAAGARSGKGGSSAASLMFPDCVKTPAEFVEVFQNPDPGARARCVSADLIGFLTSGADVAGANPAGRRQSPFWFWSGSDGLAAYLRIGYPQSLGKWTADPNDVAFPGLQQFSNGQSLLLQVGFPALYSNVGRTYSLNVASASAVRRALQAQRFSPPFPFRADVGPVSPTWANVVAGYNQALGACCGVRIPAAVVPLLDAATFRELSGCPAQCTFVATGFPSVAYPSPVVSGPRDGSGQCVPPAGAGAQVNPTYIDDISPLCDDTWKALMARYYAVYQPGCTPDAVVAAAKLFAEDLEAAASDAEAAVVVRAFAAQSCSGDFNPLFTGNGFTATGFNGLFAPTATEFVTSPIQWARLPSAAKATVYLCINGKDGGEPVNNACSP